MQFSPQALTERGTEQSRINRDRAKRARQAQVLVLHIAGMSVPEISKQMSVHQRTIWRDLADVDDTRVRVEEIMQEAGLTADDLHDTLTRMHDADLMEIVENPGEPLDQLRYKPIEQWPAIWRQGLMGKIKITPVSERSSDGVQAGNSKSWDVIGYKVEMERESLLKIIELSAKLKQVDALAAQKQDIEINVHAQVTAKLEGALRREQKMINGAGSKIIDVKPEEI